MAFFDIYSPPLGYPFTYLAETFPEHHWPAEHTRHKIGHAMHNLFVGDGTDSHGPRTEIRETLGKYYLDIELPGLTTKEKLDIKWSNRRTLTIRTTIDRPDIREEDIPDHGQLSLKESERNTENQSKPENSIHILKSERQIGPFLRTFLFSVDVDHETMEVKLQHGLLRIIVTKSPHEQVQH